MARHGVQTFGDQLLDQLGAGGLVLDQHDTGPTPLVLLAHRPLQLRVFHALPQHVDQIEVFAVDPPARVHAEIAELGRLAGCAPALHSGARVLSDFTYAVPSWSPSFAMM